MNMTQYKDLTYADSDKIGERSESQGPIDEEYEADLKQKLDEGKITQEQYNTLTKTNKRVLTDLGGGTSFVDENGYLTGLDELGPIKPPAAEPEEPQEQAPQYQVDPDY